MMSAGTPVGGYHPALSGVRVTLQNADLWQSFHKFGTEMIITKSGRRMFPYMRLQVTGLDPYSRYFIMLEMNPSSKNRFKFSGSEWVSVGAAEPQMPASARMYIHPDSPATGAHWTGQHVLLNKIKLTNNTLDTSGNIVLNSMHKYLPRVHIVMATDILAIHWSPRATFEFVETEFIAVTAYQNENVTKLKIDNNPFAKGFRDVGTSRKRKGEALQDSLKYKKEVVDSSQSTGADDSGISSVGSPTPPVTTSPITSFGSSDLCSPPLRLMQDLPIPPYLPPLWSYPYLLPPPPLYHSPYLSFPYLVPSSFQHPTYQPPVEPFLIDLSVKKESVTITSVEEP